MTTDEGAEAFLAQDLSLLDFTAFRPLTWENEPKTARINMRLPAPLMEALKGRRTQIAEFCLAHITRDAAERAYERSDLFERRRDLMQAWAGFLAGNRAAVVPLRSRQP